MEKDIKSQEKETYISPDIVIVDIQTEQRILAGGSGGAPDMPPVNW